MINNDNIISAENASRDFPSLTHNKHPGSGLTRTQEKHYSVMLTLHTHARFTHCFFYSFQSPWVNRVGALCSLAVDYLNTGINLHGFSLCAVVPLMCTCSHTIHIHYASDALIQISWLYYSFWRILTLLVTTSVISIIQIASLILMHLTKKNSSTILISAFGLGRTLLLRQRCSFWRW